MMRHRSDMNYIRRSWKTNIPDGAETPGETSSNFEENGGWASFETFSWVRYLACTIVIILPCSPHISLRRLAPIVVADGEQFLSYHSPMCHPLPLEFMRRRGAILNSSLSPLRLLLSVAM